MSGGLISKYLTFLGIGLVTVTVLRRVPQIAGDTVAMSQSAELLVSCLRNHQFHGCPGTNQYGLLQNIPLMALIWKGISTPDAVRLLGFINVVAFLAFLVFIWKSFSGRVRQLGVLVLLLGPVLPYISSTLGEMTQLVVFSLFGIAVVRNRKVLGILAGFFAATSRETAFLPLIFLAVGLSVLEFRSIKLGIKKSIPYVFATLIGLGALLEFNAMKFGTWRNLSNLHAEYVTPGILLKAKMFVAIWVAPGGGVMVFWVLGGLITLSFLVYPIIRRENWTVVGSLLVIGCVAGSTASLSMWFAPFGWVAWGPRLMIPTIAMITFGAFSLRTSDGFQFGKLEKVFGNLVFQLGVTAIVGLSALPSFGVLNIPTSINRFFSTDKVCPRPAIIQEDRNYYFHCLQHGSWKLDPSLWRVGLDGMSPFMWLTFSAVLIAFFMTLRTLGGVPRTCVEDSNVV